ncbi:MAG: WGR domain-containing protein [Myxococcota bacterium]
MAKVKAWKEGTPGEPSFPSDFEVVKKAVLQVTDIKTNRNKYYAIELHSAGAQFRVYTHYGRTDDLETNPNAGMRESRYFVSASQAEATYTKIYRQKTSKAKGYKEVSLASSRIGSHKARGQSSGHVDNQTLQRMQGEAGEKKSKPKVKKSELPAEIQDFVRYIYEEATNALTTTVAAKITANGIETPLGVLTLGQIEKGQAILDEAYGLFEKKRTSRLVDLSGEFYSAIPHRIGRSRKAVADAVIDTLEEFSAKQETLQLMRDMLTVNGDDGQVLFDDEVDKKYKVLGCEIDWVSPKSSTFAELKDYVEKSQVKSHRIKVKRIYSVKRGDENDAFDEKLGNEKMLFHGSRAKNWVGILSRGILLPKIVVSMGVNRTDAGWLGHGIYFGDAACTTLYYTRPGRRKTRMMTVARVALGKTKQYKKITYGLNGPPTGYDSCHGVRAKPKEPSQFEDDEFCIYRAEQKKMEYLVEFAA